MTIAEHHLFARLLVGEPHGSERPRVVTFGPGEEDWAVVDPDGQVAYVGPALFAARYAASLER